ncbi:alpha/beta fold hydrolase [Solibacillus cecembensis]|uniref:alpha/beta fold hydrolase n=1 Tax=Solibacillus cecembensis TaxID=459347 RepID=UPI003D02EEB1
MSVMERNNVKIVGEGTQVIMFGHGFGCSQEMWQYIVPAFEKDYRIILFDYIGSGHSDAHFYTSERYSSLQGYAQDVLDIVEELQLEELIFVGHSISGMIGMLAAIAKPQQFSKLIMVGPSPCYINEGDYQGGFEKSDIEELLTMMEMNFTGWASYLAPVAMHEENKHHAATLEDSFVSTNPRIAREFAEVTFFADYRHRLHELQTPTLLLQCAEDSIVPLNVGVYLQEHIKNSELQVMEAKGHYPHMSHPIETIEKIKAYI